MPSFSFNADRAAQVGQQVELEARRAAAQLGSLPAGAPQAPVPQTWGASQPQPGPQQSYQPASPPVYQPAVPPGYPQQTAQPYYPAYR
jgi:hypothetical protein